MVLKPRQETIWVKSMTTSYNHCISAYSQIILAHCTHWCLQTSFKILFAVYLTDLYHRDLLYCILLCWSPLLLLLICCQVYHSLQNVITKVTKRSEILREIGSKVVGVEVSIVEIASHREVIEHPGEAKGSEELVEVVILLEDRGSTKGVSKA